MSTTLQGRGGEAQAAAYLRKQGYRILAAGYRSRFGEIDLIARKRGITAIVEVKTRRDDSFAKAMEFVDWHKQQKLKLTAQQWLGTQSDDPQLRFDVIEVYPGGKINHIENAFQ